MLLRPVKISEHHTKYYLALLSIKIALYIVSNMIVHVLFSFVFFYLHPHKCLIVQFHNSWGWPQKWHRGTVVVQAVGQRTLGMPMERGGFHGHVCHPVLGPPKRGLRANLGLHCRPGTCLHCRGYSLRTVRDRGDLSTLFYRQFFPKNPKK